MEWQQSSCQVDQLSSGVSLGAISFCSCQGSSHENWGQQRRQLKPAVVGYGLASVKNQKLSSIPGAIILSRWLSRKQGLDWDMCAVVKECRKIRIWSRNVWACMFVMLVRWQHWWWWLQRQGGERCGKHLCYLNKNDLDLEARISDIYHVISCIRHFLWIL